MLILILGYVLPLIICILYDILCWESKEWCDKVRVSSVQDLFVVILLGLIPVINIILCIYFSYIRLIMKHLPPHLK